MKRALAAVLSLPLFAFATPVFAHAFLDHAVPRVGSVVHAPTEVKVSFTQRLEPAFSTLQVYDRDGRRVDKGDAHLDLADATLFIVSLPALPPGKYRVKWRALSVDTHVTEGDFEFEIAP